MWSGCKRTKRREPSARLWMPLEVQIKGKDQGRLPPFGVIASQALVEIAVGVLCASVHRLWLDLCAHTLEIGRGCSAAHSCVCRRILLLSFPQQVLTKRAAQLVLEHEPAGGSR